MILMGLLLAAVTGEQIGKAQDRATEKEGRALYVNGIRTIPSSDMKVGANGLELRPPGLFVRLRSFLWETIKKTIRISGVAICLGLGIATVNHFSTAWQEAGLGAPPSSSLGPAQKNPLVGSSGTLVASGQSAQSGFADTWGQIYSG